MEKLQGSAPAKTVNKQVENVISLSELMVEICFPTDGSDPLDLAELEKEEESEHQGHVVRVSNLKDKLKHRGTKKLMTLKPIQASVDAVSISLYNWHVVVLQFPIVLPIFSYPPSQLM